jgi:hypothetical protein
MTRRITEGALVAFSTLILLGCGTQGGRPVVDDYAGDLNFCQANRANAESCMKSLGWLDREGG